ncbi:hypothetical protein D4A35_03090 [Paraclostridium bifermentans]|uniref:Uncharacterized protein n=1 Tax=Paraclostridium bifermentans TaxID=1490 RepID=A0A5P3XAI4_PARBF|nr:ABC-three component system middle component 1 [Paraclostridium bifermentans]QEZ67967.1 hypothetical protein D4A35_03090 [Paraclostridium bifermentans]
MYNIVKKIFEEYNFQCINMYEYPKVNLKKYKLKENEHLKKLSLKEKHFISTDKYILKQYIDKIDLYIPHKEEQKIEYFAVINLKKPKIEDLDKLISEDFNRMFIDIKESKNYNSYMDKNMSLIVLLEVDDMEENSDNLRLTKKIFDIEENRYNFKKYVLTYDKNQASLIKEKVKYENSITKCISEIIYDTIKFTEFKNNPNKSTLYSLVSKLYIKLPFLKLKAKEKNIESLNRKIKNELEENEYIELVDTVLKINDIPKLSDEKIISLLEEID